MNNKVLLVNPSNLKRSEKYPPLSLIWLSAFLERNGYSVDILEANALDLTFEETIAAIRESGASFCGFTLMTPQAEYVAELIRELKQRQPELVVVAGGVHISIVPEDFLKQCPHVDYLVIGEGEYTTLELFDALRHGHGTDNIAGLGFIRDGLPVIAPRRPLIEDLDELPMPAWEKLPIDRYEIMTPERVNDPTKGEGLTISSERGCPFNCTFCASGSVYGKSYRSRSALKTIEEIEFIVSRYGIRNFFFVDEVLTFTEGTILELCRLIVERKLDIKWSCNSRCNAKGLTARTVEAMKRAGCVRIDFGIESGSPRILKSIKKGIRLHHVYEAVKLVHDQGMYTTAIMIIGLMGEDLDDIRLTMRMILNIEPEIALFGAATPFPGTALYAEALASGYLNTHNWSEYYIGNRKPVMRTGHFNESRINELVDYTYSVALIVSRLSDYKRHCAHSLGTTFRLYLGLILELKSFLSIADKVRWIKMFLLKRRSERYVAETIGGLDLVCRSLDNYSFRPISRALLMSLVPDGKKPDLLFVFREYDYSIPHLINLVQTCFPDGYTVRLQSEHDVRFEEFRESEHISYGPATPGLKYDGAFYFADRKLTLAGLAGLLGALFISKVAGRSRRQFLASIGLKIYEADAATIFQVARGLFSQLYSILSLPISLVYLMYLTVVTNELENKEKFMPTYMHEKSRE